MIEAIGVFADTIIAVKRIQHARYFVLFYASVELMCFVFSALDDARVGIGAVTFDVYSETVEAFMYTLAIKLSLVDGRSY